MRIGATDCAKIALVLGCYCLGSVRLGLSREVLVVRLAGAGDEAIDDSVGVLLGGEGGSHNDGLHGAFRRR